MEWISTKEKLPNSTKYYFVIDNNGINICRCINKKTNTWEDKQHNNSMVNFWQPLEIE